MSYKDWDEDLLNFDYSSPVPDRETSSRRANRIAVDNHEDIEEALRREEERARKLQEEYERVRAASRADREHAKALHEASQNLSELINGVAEPVEVSRRAAMPSTDRSTATRGRTVAAAATTNSARKDSKFNKFARGMSIPYLVLLVVFAAIMAIMDVLPIYYLIALYVVLGLLSFIIVKQMRQSNAKKWAKVLSTCMAILLMGLFGLGSAYSVGTLSFLDKTSVQNESKVAHITKEPFSVLITGMDVWGKVDEQGRSDVNMLVTVNPETETLLMTSIPRDYEIQMPDMGYATDKLTHTGFYSVETTIGAVENLLNTTANYYVKVNFTTIVKFIDAIGGLDFYNETAFDSAIADYSYAEGNIHVGGKAALYYARERKAFLEGDNQRIKNQQLIFGEMLKKATSSKTMLLSYNKILSSLDDYFEMSISSREIRSLVKMQLARNIKWKMYKNTVVGGNGSMGTYTTGSQACYVMTQDATSVANAQELIQATLQGKQLGKDDDGNVIIVEKENSDEAA